MPGFFEQAKKAMEMRNQMKRLQREIEEMTKEYENGGVKVVVSGDMVVKSIEIADKSLLSPEREDSFSAFSHMLGVGSNFMLSISFRLKRICCSP